jgi:superfamily II DNA or RNA helicase
VTHLRPYQEEAISSIIDYWAGGGGNPLCDMATGTGKSVVISTLVRRLIEADPDVRILMLVHVKELVQQNANVLLRSWPQAPIGINAAGLGRRDKRSQILYASIQSVAKEDAHSLGPRHVIIVDEAHLIPKSGNGQYRKLIDKMKLAVPGLRIAGFTATPYRLDSGRLDDGGDALFDDVVYSYDIGRGVDDGYLSPLTCRRTGAVIDVSEVKRAGGEFVAGALEAAVNKDSVTQSACDEIVAKGADRRAWLAFCAGVAHAEAVRDALRSRGVHAEMVTGETPKGDRDRIIRDFREGRIKCLTNANVLTTGFDAPICDLIAMLRPTLSTSLYVQMLGRGTRLNEGKADCIAEGQLVLTDHGLIPIELVKTSMKIWDGVEYVSHCGAVFRGEQEVISYAGITATPDHKVWTKEGWRSFGDCALARTPIAITGDGRSPVREAEGRFWRDRAEEGKGARSCAGRMHDLRGAVSEGFDFAQRRVRWLPEMWEPSVRAEMAGNARDLSEAEMHKPERLSFRALWRTRNRVSVSGSDRYGRMGSRELGPAQRIGDRSDRQRWSLRAWEPSLFDWHAKLGAYTKAHVDGAIAFVSRSFSASKICRRDNQATSWAWPFSGRNQRTVLQSPIVKTKRRVWDILNAGPLHRFTVEGLLVSNCLVLDFAENVRRHGPVDAIHISGRGSKGDGGGRTEVDAIKAKACPHCETLVSVRVYECTGCGYEWERPAEPKHHARADTDAAVMSREIVNRWLQVASVDAARHEKPGSIPSMRVEYYVGVTEYKEWVCVEHPGFAGAKAAKWWRAIVGTPAPASVADGVARLADEAHILAITIQRDGKYWRVSAWRVRRPDGRIVEIDDKLNARPVALQIVREAAE